MGASVSLPIWWAQHCVTGGAVAGLAAVTNCAQVAVIAGGSIRHWQKDAGRGDVWHPLPVLHAHKDTQQVCCHNTTSGGSFVQCCRSTSFAQLCRVFAASTASIDNTQHACHF
jgi:hypothetical protein